MGDSYIKKRFGGEQASLRELLTAYLERLKILRQEDGHNLVVVYAELLPLVPAWLEQKLLKRPYILDFDDAFYLKYRSGRLRLFRPLLGGKFDQLIQGATAVTAPHHLCGGLINGRFPQTG